MGDSVPGETSRSLTLLDKILRFLSTAQDSKTLQEVADAVGSTIEETSKALNILASIGLIILNENGATIDSKVREMLEAEVA